MKKLILFLILLFTLDLSAQVTRASLWEWVSAQRIKSRTGVTSVLPSVTNAVNFGASGTIWNLIYGDTLISNAVLSPYIIGGTATTSGLYFKTTTGVGTTGADMHFLVGNNGGTEAMTILNSGNAGFGVTNPTQGRLVSLSSSSAVGLAILARSSDDIYGQIDFYNNAGTTKYGIIGAQRVGTNGGSLYFYSKPDGGNITETMTIASTGNTGFGTTTPLHKQATVSAIATNLNAFNFVNSDINKVRTTIAQSEDTSSVHLRFSSLGSPTFRVKGKTGNTLFWVDSSTVTVPALTLNNGVTPTGITLYSKDATGTNDRYTSNGWGTGADSLKYSIAQTYNGGSIQGSFNLTGFSNYVADAPIGNTAHQPITLGASATTFAVTKNVITVTGDAGANVIATITGAVVGIYTFIFVDGLVTITDNDAHDANSVDLAGTATDFTSADDKTLQLVFDGTSWYQVGTSTN